MKSKNKVGEKSPTPVIRKLGVNYGKEYVLYPFRVRVTSGKQIDRGNSSILRRKSDNSWTWRFVMSPALTELQALYIVQTLYKNPRRARSLAKKFAEKVGLLHAD